MKIIGILAIGYILADWYFTGNRPADWFIAVMLILIIIDWAFEIK